MVVTLCRPRRELLGHRLRTHGRHPGIYPTSGIQSLPAPQECFVFFGTLTAILRRAPLLPQCNLGAMGPREVDSLTQCHTARSLDSRAQVSRFTDLPVTVLGLGVVCEVPAQPSPSLHLLPAWRKCERKLWLPLLSAGPPSQAGYILLTYKPQQGRAQLRYCSDPQPRH